MAELTEEDLKNMTPEQIMELQKQQCIFCKIVSGEIPAKKVYDDETCVAALDINPAAQGHMLLLPKNHYQIMPQIPEEGIKHLAIISKQLSQAALKSFTAQGTNIFIANGALAGQKAPHFMIHIVPRKDGDNVEGFNIPEGKISDKDVAEIQKVISERLSGKPVESKKEEPKKPEKKEIKVEKKPKESKEESTEKKEESGVDIETIAGMFKK